MNAVTRRKMIALSARVTTATLLFPHIATAREETYAGQNGVVVGEPAAASIGEKFLAEGYNAIDAAIATALAATITSPSKCGVGGYGGHAIIALANGKVTAIDFNSTAPLAATPDMYPLDAKGNVKGKVNVHGWLSIGVPGVLAGMELALKRFGTASLHKVLEPAIQLCERGVLVRKEAKSEHELDASQNNASPDSVQSGATTRQQNLPLAGLLRQLAKENSTESFYRGAIARKIAKAFEENGGLITYEDLAAYRAVEVKPITLEWNGMTIHTPPLTAAGTSYLQALAILKRMNWEKLSAPDRLHAKVEALRIAWMDRNKFFGDPAHVQVPLDRLFSRSEIKRRSEQIALALKKRKPVPNDTTESVDEGTMNISAVDRAGNMIAITFTHGSGYGSRVSVSDLGMVLGHGMWRFEPRPGHPNSPGPRKKAINNMCPAAITRRGKPVMAVGGAGGTRIPCSIYEVLLNYVGLGTSLPDAMNAPRVHTTGTLRLEVEKDGSTQEADLLRQIGYQVANAGSAYVSAVARDPRDKYLGIMRGGS